MRQVFIGWGVAVKRKAAGPVSYTHLDVYKRQSRRYTEGNGIRRYG